jgi:hypothetical protein
MWCRFVIWIGILFVSLCLTGFTSAKKDPLDPGSADTLYFKAGEPCSENGDTLFIPSDTSGGEVTVYIGVWNDNPIQGFAVPLIDTCNLAFLDSARNNGDFTPVCFQGGRVEDFTFLTLNLDFNPPQVFYGAVSVESPLPPGDGDFAKMIYTIPPGISDTCICVDTSFFPPVSILSFVRVDAVEYIPVFRKKCFRIALGEQTDVPESNLLKRFDFALKQNYPNPFNSLTTIQFTVNVKRSTVNYPLHINLTIYNILGQKVRILLDEEKTPGEYQIVWDGKDEQGKNVASGIYLYELSIEDFKLIQKMVLLR